VLIVAVNVENVVCFIAIVFWSVWTMDEGAVVHNQAFCTPRGDGVDGYTVIGQEFNGKKGLFTI